MIKVAIAEDDFRVAMIHEKFLEKVKGVVLVGKALNGQETLSLLEAEEVDLLLLDIYMPDMLGINLIKDLRLHFPNVDVMMISASTDVEMVEASIRYGVVDYVIKPVDFEMFQAKIVNYIQKKNLLSSNNEVTQNVIDKYFGMPKEIDEELGNTPKGIDPLTLDKVKKIMLEHKELGFTAEELGEKLGASRTTARRYLEYLISTEEARAELSYGIVGRPERKYFRK